MALGCCQNGSHHPQSSLFTLIIMPVSPDIRSEFHKAFRLVSAPFRRLPDFIMPGAPKCGTSSLYDVLVQHPGVRRASRKEPTNFIHYPTSVLRSRMHFPFATGNFITGEASVEYFIHPDAPRHIHDIVPDVRLIFMFRDPIKRAWSDYQMFRRSGHEKEAFSDVVEREIRWHADSSLAPLIASAARNAYSPVRYLLIGMYRQVLEHWLAVFPREKCLFIISEDFFRDGSMVLTQVQQFLGLPPCDPGPIPHARDGGYSEKIDSSTLEKLRTFYASHNQSLAGFLQRDLPW